MWRVALYRALAILGIIAIVFFRPPFSFKTLSLLEPFLIATVLALLAFSYYLRARMNRDTGVEEAQPAFRESLRGGQVRATGFARILVSVAALVFVWFGWSYQPIRIFNATVLVVVWGLVEVSNSLIVFWRTRVRAENRIMERL